MNWKPLNRKPFDPNEEIRSGLHENEIKSPKQSWKC